MLDLRKNYLGFISSRVTYPYLKTDHPIHNSYIQKSYDCPWFYNNQWKTLEFFQLNKVCKDFYILFFINQWEQNNLLEYKELNEHATNEERGILTESVFFPTRSLFDVD